jgi:hypothetical protein
MLTVLSVVATTTLFCTDNKRIVSTGNINLIGHCLTSLNYDIYAYFISNGKYFWP